MDEVSLIIDILTNNWSASVTALTDAGVITATHNSTPNFVDVRTLQKNKGVRYDLSSKDVIIIFEDSQSIQYPTIHYDMRNETYGFTMHIRTIHDERAGGSEDFGRERLRALYLIARHVLEGVRRGYTAADGSCFNQLFVGSRTESNDRAKRLFGYKVSIEAKRFALTVP